MKRILSTSEAAEILGVSSDTVKKYCSGVGLHRKYLPNAVKNRWNRWEIPASDVKKRIKSLAKNDS